MITVGESVILFEEKRSRLNGTCVEEFTNCRRMTAAIDTVAMKKTGTRYLRLKIMVTHWKEKSSRTIERPAGHIRNRMHGLTWEAYLQL